MVGRYLSIKDYGTYRISAYSDDHTVTLAVSGGQNSATDATVTAAWLEAIYDLPSDFNGMSMSKVCYPYTDTYDVPPLHETSTDEIQRMWRDDNEDDEAPTHFAVAPAPFTASTGQRWQLWLAARPTNARVVRYWPVIDPALLADSSSVYFVGGSKHWETIVTLALAQWEWETLKQVGPMEMKARERLSNSIAIDRALFDTESIPSLADAETGISWE
jgi:hypothetical protein